jgi:omega-hydroxy-beta-dihydromenaquinone-9 sulfotransferase
METIIGISAPGWAQLLKENHFRIAPRYTGRALLVTLASLVVSASRRYDDEIFRTEIEGKVKIEDPVFVLGHWRSGTTLLHSLLSVDKQFVTPSSFEVMNPLTFLRNEDQVYQNYREHHKKRPMDNLSVGVDNPAEDEFALASLCFRSPMIGWAFSENALFYDRFISFKDASPEELRAWEKALHTFLSKVVYKHPGRLMLKSPPHTGRVRLLLSHFPKARFIHIYRNPYDVFLSNIKLYETFVPMQYLQKPLTARQCEESIFRRYNLLYEALFEDIPQIPAGQYCEVKFEGLEKNFLGNLQNIYDCLGLLGFEENEQAFRRYIGTLTGYQKNQHPEIEERLKKRIAHDWERSFDAWKYPYA